MWPYLHTHQEVGFVRALCLEAEARVAASYVPSGHGHGHGNGHGHGQRHTAEHLFVWFVRLLQLSAPVQCMLHGEPTPAPLSKGLGHWHFRHTSLRANCTSPQSGQTQSPDFPNPLPSHEEVVRTTFGQNGSVHNTYEIMVLTNAQMNELPGVASLVAYSRGGLPKQKVGCCRRPQHRRHESVQTFLPNCAPDAFDLARALSRIAFDMACSSSSCTTLAAS